MIEIINKLLRKVGYVTKDENDKLREDFELLRTDLKAARTKLISVYTELKALKKEHKEKNVENKNKPSNNISSKLSKAKVERLKEWAKRVKEAANYTCDICNEKKSKELITAHHLYDKSNHPSLMFQDENGVCLCSDCHNAFHAKYTVKSHCTPAIYQKFKIFRQAEFILTKKIA